MRTLIARLSLPLYLALCLVVAAQADVPIHLERAVGGGIQPQVAIDTGGALHLIYFKGEEGAGDLFYVRRADSGAPFSEPMRVNSVPASAIAVGTIRGGQIALGENGRVHVVWNGSSQVKGERGAPMLYTRLNDSGTGFEPQRDLMQRSQVLDGGGTIAADQRGNVYVAWHGNVIGAAGGEAQRRVWIARSKDSGVSFSPEAPAWDQPTGACGCCSMRALATESGSVHLLYRSASGGTRDIYGLSWSGSNEDPFAGRLVHPWEISSCPMSSLALAEGSDRVVSAWETAGQIYLSWSKPGTHEFAEPVAVPRNDAETATERKHPTLAVNARGDILVAWTEGTGWKRGGDLVWQVFDSTGQATDQSGRIQGGIPVWGLPAAAARGDEFILLH